MTTTFEILEVRACPQEDGTITYLGMAADGDGERMLTPAEAFTALLDGAFITLALNDPHDGHTHWETPPTQFFKV